MRRYFLVFLSMFLFQGSAYAGWGLKDLDPCNKNRGLGRCLHQTKPLTICGKTLQVPIVSYAACQTSAYLIPESCHPGVIAMTEGSACWASAGLMATTCGISIEGMRQVAEACVLQR